MIAAPVGFQCPQCVQAARAPQPRPSPGLDFTGARQAYVTWTLAALYAGVFGLELAFGVEASAAVYGMHPLSIALGGEWWRLFTSEFLHGSLLHIGFNVLVLVSVGPALERALGHVRFLAVYLLAGLGGAIASYSFSSPLTVSVGASGAIFGLMGALVVAGRSLRVDVTQVLVLIGINLVIGFVPGTNIDWRAHVGGLVTGAATAGVFVLASRAGVRAGSRQKAAVTMIDAGGLIAVALVLAGLFLWRSDQLRSAVVVRPAGQLALAPAPSSGVPSTPVPGIPAGSGTITPVAAHPASGADPGS